MKKINVLNVKGEKTSDIALNEKVWGIEPNDAVIYDAVRLARNAERQGTAETKTRSDVSGGGAKPWRQKGTGRARQGSTRAPHWYHGGVVFGPHANRNYTQKQNRKERVLALKSALSSKVLSNELIVVDSLEIADLKTKTVKDLIKAIKAEGKVLFVTKGEAENLYMATRNLGYVLSIMAEDLNVFDLINADTVVCDEEAIEYIEEVLK